MDDLFACVAKLRQKDRTLWIAKVRRHASRAQWMMTMELKKLVRPLSGNQYERR